MTSLKITTNEFLPPDPETVDGPVESGAVDAGAGGVGADLTASTPGCEPKLRPGNLSTAVPSATHRAAPQAPTRAPAIVAAWGSGKRKPALRKQDELSSGKDRSLTEIVESLAVAYADRKGDLVLVGRRIGLDVGMVDFRRPVHSILLSMLFGAAREDKSSAFINEAMACANGPLLIDPGPHPVRADLKNEVIYHVGEVDLGTEWLLDSVRNLGKAYANREDELLLVCRKLGAPVDGIDFSGGAFEIISDVLEATERNGMRLEFWLPFLRRLVIAASNPPLGQPVSSLSPIEVSFDLRAAFRAEKVFPNSRLVDLFDSLANTYAGRNPDILRIAKCTGLSVSQVEWEKSSSLVLFDCLNQALDAKDQADQAYHFFSALIAEVPNLTWPPPSIPDPPSKLVNRARTAWFWEQPNLLAEIFAGRRNDLMALGTLVECRIAEITGASTTKGILLALFEHFDLFQWNRFVAVALKMA